MPSVAPPQAGAKPVFGTNPMCFAVPTDGAPVVLDMATAAVALFGVLTAKAKGEPLPEGSAYDESGARHATTRHAARRAAAAAIADRYAPAAARARERRRPALTRALTSRIVCVSRPGAFTTDANAVPPTGPGAIAAFGGHKVGSGRSSSLSSSSSSRGRRTAGAGVGFVPFLSSRLPESPLCCDAAVFRNRGATAAYLARATPTARCAQGAALALMVELLAGALPGAAVLGQCRLFVALTRRSVRISRRATTRSPSRSS